MRFELLGLAALAAAIPTATQQEADLEPRSTTAVVASPNAYTGTSNTDGVQRTPSKPYTSYSGNGTTQAGWPTKFQWISFGSMVSLNQNNMLHACGWNGWKSYYGVAAPDTTQAELNSVISAVNQIASSSGVDHRFILATILQESAGCVRVPTTKNGFYNPGMMQSFQGNGTCNDSFNTNNSNYTMNVPCPDAKIYTMVKDGAVGTAGGPGLATDINQAASDGVTGATVFYRASRYYNSGSICSPDLSQACGATASYASDIANRLVGWVPS